MRLIQALALCAVAALLVSGVAFGGYVLVKRISSATCYGCLGLNPEFTPFEGFLTKNVSHPEWVIDTLKDGKIVFIFLWQIGCDPCEAQWGAMKNAGIVKGTEENGGIGDKYKDEVKLFSLDASSLTDLQGEEAMNVYNQGGGTPTTVIITLVKDNKTNDVKIGWYSFAGYESGKPTMSYLENIIESGIYYYNENESQWAT
jgi:hypothetical protein